MSEANEEQNKRFFSEGKKEGLRVYEQSFSDGESAKRLYRVRAVGYNCRAKRGDNMVGNGSVLGC